ncbi:hypothetical protein JVX90_09460 [Gordonia sp. PDNC005]|uniref:hypothetical protein n=1 Tax=unclassified Gordonia (in: high G+C Gram-positive bacteria) TaxID=2657482 RepID=UPI0019647E6E|nr:hypothetical protein [Gordonia sp. PDNC005]QRY64368.1 hypothetical protein JVX90_09460 [Gordonia sp. PDNC005]
MRHCRPAALLIALIVFALGVVSMIGAGAALADCMGYKDDQARIDSTLGNDGARTYAAVAKGRVVDQKTIERDVTGSLRLTLVDIKVTEAYRGVSVGEVMRVATTPDISTWREFTTGSDYFIALKEFRGGEFVDLDVSRWAHLYDDDCSPTVPTDEVGPEFFAELRAKTGVTAAPSCETSAADPGRSSDATFVWLGAAGGVALVIAAAALVWRARRDRDQ